jgi:hypothetical protein
MCITASSVNFTGSREHQRAAERPVRLQVGWEKAGEGNPDDPAQARSQMSEHVKVVGLLLVWRGHVPTHMRSRTAPQVITRRNVVGTLVCRTA